MSEHRPSSANASSRRAFLTQAAATLGAAAILAKPIKASAKPFIAVRGKGATPPKEGQPIRMAVIGTGGMGTAHCDAFLNFNDQGKDKLEIVALADPWPMNLNRALEKCKQRQPNTEVTAYANYKDILRRDDVHAVLIASPEHWHSLHAIDAITAGKDVYLEKPMTLHLDEALQLHQVVNANPDVMFQVGTQAIQQPKYREAKKVVASEMIGQPTCSQTSYCRNNKNGEWNYYHVDPNWKAGKDVDWESWCGPLGKVPFDPYLLNRWRRYRLTSTGIIGDLLVHVMTPLMYSLEMGWPTRVHATGLHLVDKAMENHDQINIVVEFEKGHTMIVTGSTCNEVGLETVIRGHKANIYLGGRHCVIRPERIYVDDIEPETIECPDIGNDQDLHRLAWLKSVRSRETPECGADLGTKVMVVVDLATRSAWSGKAFKFDPKSMTASEA